jgi:putative Holliday junction resolvase
MRDKKRMRIMSMDIGSRTIGVAISDELGMTAQGLKTIKRRSIEEDLKEISLIIEQYKIDKIVVGLPKNMDGTVGKQAGVVLQWIKTFQEKISIPVETWDERLSTVEASKILLEADLSRKKRKGVIDKLAAVLILQGYLNQTGKNDDEPSLST